MNVRTLKKPVVATLILALIIIIGLWFYGELTKPTVEEAVPPTKVTYAIAKATDWNVHIPATGTLAANQGIIIKSAVTSGGIISGIFFRSGQFVKAGQPLFQINPGADKTIIKAPFSGRLGLKYVDLGDYVTMGTELVPLQNSNPLKLVFSIPQTYLSDVAIGDVALVSADAYPGKTFKGSVYAINAALDSTTRSISMWASIPNPEEKLLPGMFVNVNLIIARKQHVIVIPKSAIVYTSAGDYVLTVDTKNNTAIKKYVTIAATLDDEVGVSKGIDDGDEVITSNLMILDDGYPIKPTGESDGTPSVVNS